MTRRRIITDLEIRLQSPNLSLSGRLRDQAILKQLKKDEDLAERYRELQGYVARLKGQGLEEGRKYCWRYGWDVVEQCEVCESCPEPGDLAWNEEE